jgi:hypothetical protein
MITAKNQTKNIKIALKNNNIIAAIDIEKQNFAKQIVDKFPKGGVSGWLPDNGFKIKFNIVKVTPPRDVKIEPYMKEDIRRLIAANKGSKTVNLQKMLSDKRTQAKVIVNKQTLKLPFEALDKELQKQAKDAKQKK